MNTIHLNKVYPEAFAALPIPYQNDDCLEFDDALGVLVAYPKEDQIQALGDWESYFCPKEKKWKEIWRRSDDKPSGT